MASHLAIAAIDYYHSIPWTTDMGTTQDVVEGEQGIVDAVFAEEGHG